MLTLITGTPGAGKSLYAVWHFGRPVPGSTIENNGVAVPRRLLSNVKDLLVEHETIDAERLATWHEWAQPGDVILYDEVQEVWRTRAMGSKVPDCIAALETHRHKGVDLILVTQHPMLLDQNIRRLVNQHLHVRRLAKGVAMVYEWDHCSDPGKVRGALQSRVWWYPKKCFALYKSAQLHTKTTAGLPRVVLAGVAAVAGLAFGGPMVYDRLSSRFKPAETVAAPAPVASPPTRPASAAGRPAQALAPAGPGPASPQVPVAAPRPLLGCITTAKRCGCFTAEGALVPQPDAVCRATAATPGALILSEAKPLLGDNTGAP